MTCKPVLFLDIDGVLNCVTTPGSTDKKLDRDMVARLARVLQATGCHVVVSSTWRAGGVAHVVLTLERYGFPRELRRRFIDVTEWSVDPPKSGIVWGQTRGLEIGEWLGRHPDVRTFAIVDDDSDMGSLRGHLVQTAWATGLQDVHVEELIRRLKGDAT